MKTNVAFMVVVVVVLTVSSYSASSQEVSPHQHTVPPGNARFEIVQSQLAARWTFRLDRFTGQVSQLVKTLGDSNTWEPMEVIGLPLSIPLTERFQIFTSGLAARHTYLLDTKSGRTWVIVSGTRQRADGSQYNVNLWEPFVE